MYNVVASLLVLTFLAGSARADDTSPSAPTRRDLLALAFPGWHPASLAEVPAGKPAIQRLRVPKVAWPFHGGIGDSTNQPRDIVKIAPLDVVRMDDTHAVLATWALSSDDHRAAACDSYYCTYALGLYFFEWADAGWHLRKRMDVATSLDGSAAPASRVQMWPGRGAVLGISQENCHGGDCVDRLQLLGLETGRIGFRFDMATGIYEGDRFSPDPCSEVVDPAYKPRPEENYANVNCRLAHGQWRVDGDTLRVDIEESSRKAHDDPQGNPVLGKLRIQQRVVRLARQGSTLKVVDGKLPDYAL